MTNIKEWARHEPHRHQLAENLKAPYMEAAIEVLQQSNMPQTAASSDVTALALLHQFQAGWHACLAALKNLPNIDGALLEKKAKAAQLEAYGAWSNPASLNPQTDHLR